MNTFDLFTAAILFLVLIDKHFIIRKLKFLMAQNDSISAALDALELKVDAGVEKIISQKDALTDEQATAVVSRINNATAKIDAALNPPADVQAPAGDGAAVAAQ